MDAKCGVLLKDVKDVLDKNGLKPYWEGSTGGYSFSIKEGDIRRILLASGERFVKRLLPNYETHRFNSASIHTRTLPEYAYHPLMFAPDTPIGETATLLNAKQDFMFSGDEMYYEKTVDLSKLTESCIEDLDNALKNMKGLARIVAERYNTILKEEILGQKKVWQESGDGLVNRTGTRF